MSAYRFSSAILATGFMLSKSKTQSAGLDNESNPRRAICIMDAQPNEVAKGVVEFEQKSAFENTSIVGRFTGLTPGQKHGFHVHQYGNLIEGCKTAGPHYNPFNKTHGGPMSEVRHVGDLGNVQADAQGNGLYEHVDHEIKLFGPYSVVGRACVLHKDEDDLGLGGHELSPITGNAGARIACGVIGLAAGDPAPK